MKLDINKLYKPEEWYKTALLLFGFTLPLWREINVIVMWLLGLSWLLLPWNEKIKNLKRHRYSLIAIALVYLSYVYLALINCPQYCNFDQVGQSIGLLLLPVFILGVNKQRIPYSGIFKALGAGLFAGMLLSWADVLITIYKRPFPFFHELQYFFQWIYTGENLLRKLHFHPSYYAVLLVLFLSVLLFGQTLQPLKHKHKIGISLLVALMLLFLFETNSRIGIIGFLLLVVINSMKNFKVKNLLWMFMVMGLVVWASLQFDFLHKKMLQLLQGEERIFRWKAIGELFVKQKNWFWGLGENRATDLYLEAYRKGGYHTALKHAYNAHNQYLELLFKAGILGISTFVYALFHLARKTRLKQDTLYFWVLMVLFAGGESFLQRNKGIFIFAFFYSIFVVFYSRNNSK